MLSGGYLKSNASLFLPKTTRIEFVDLIDVPHSIRRSLMQSEPTITWSLTVAEYFVSIADEEEPVFPCICWSSLDEERGVESDYEMEDEDPAREYGG